MSKFTEKIKKLYEEKKKLDNPPKYLKTIEEILELEETELNLDSKPNH